MQAASRTSAHEEITVLLLGDGPLLEPLEQALAAAGHDVEVGPAHHASAMFTAVAPELVVLCGSATEHGGAPVLAALSEGARDAELKVVVLGAASSSARATALAPNLPPKDLARRLAELARAPVPAARSAVKPAAPPKTDPKRSAAAPLTAPKPVEPKPAAPVLTAPKPVEPPKPPAPGLTAPKPVELPRSIAAAPTPVQAPRPATRAAPKLERRTLVGIPMLGACVPAAEARPAAITPTRVLEPAAPSAPPAAPAVAVPTAQQEDAQDAEVGVVFEVAPPSEPTTQPPAALAPPVMALPAPPPPQPAALPTEPEVVAAAPSIWSRTRRRIPQLATAAALATSALGLLLLPGLGSHAEGARKLSAVEITGAIAPRAIAAAPPPMPPTARDAEPIAATPVAPSEPVVPAAPVIPVAADPPSAPDAADFDSVRPLPSPTPATARAGGTRPLSREASLTQAKTAVRKAEGYVRDGRLGMAEAAYLKALSLFPRYPLAIAGLARIHLQRRDAGEALRWAKMLVATQPNRGNNQRMLGDAYALTGKQADATRAWQQAVRYGDRTARQRLGD